MKTGSDLSPLQFLRSSIVDVKIFGNDSDQKNPVDLQMRVDYVFPGSKRFSQYRRHELYCLSELIDNQWVCRYKHQRGTGSKLMTFKIEKDGIYAVTFYPSMEIDSEV